MTLEQKEEHAEHRGDEALTLTKPFIHSASSYLWAALGKQSQLGCSDSLQAQECGWGGTLEHYNNKYKRHKFGPGMREAGIREGSLEEIGTTSPRTRQGTGLHSRGRARATVRGRDIAWLEVCRPATGQSSGGRGWEMKVEKSRR